MMTVETVNNDVPCLVQKPKKKGESFVLYVLKKTSKRDRFRMALSAAAMAMASLTNLSLPLVVGKGIDMAIAVESSGKVKSATISAISIFLLGSLASLTRTYNVRYLTHKLKSKLRKQLFLHTLSQNPALIDLSLPKQEGRVGELLLCYQNDVENIVDCTFNTITNFFRYSNSIFGGLAAMFMISPKLTLISLGTIPLVGLGSMAFGRFSSKVSKRLREETGEHMSFIDDKFANVRTIQIFDGVERQVEIFDGSQKKIKNWARKAALADGMLYGVLSFCGNFSIASILYKGGKLISQKQMSVGNLSSFAIYCGLMLLGVSGMAKVFSEYRKTASSSQKILSLLAPLALEAREESEGEEKTGEEKTGEEKTGEERKEKGGEERRGEEGVKLAFNKVNFGYSEEAGLVLKNFSMEVKKGEKVAIIGKSGVGKSTLINILTKFYGPADVQARVSVDDRTLEETETKEWRRRKIGVVSNDFPLLHQNLMGNMNIGDAIYSEVDVLDVLNKYACADFITQENLNSVDLHSLSLGQRQRLLIARTMLRNASAGLFLFDECTSALDTLTENQILQQIDLATEGKTVIHITHKKNLMQRMDRVLIFDEGEIKETGKFDDLYNKKNSLLRTILDDHAHA